MPALSRKHHYRERYKIGDKIVLKGTLQNQGDVYVIAMVDHSHEQVKVNLININTGLRWINAVEISRKLLYNLSGQGVDHDLLVGLFSIDERFHTVSKISSQEGETNASSDKLDVKQ